MGPVGEVVGVAPAVESVASGVGAALVAGFQCLRMAGGMVRVARPTSKTVSPFRVMGVMVASQAMRWAVWGVTTVPSSSQGRPGSPARTCGDTVRVGTTRV